MSYHNLSECTLTADERREEKDRICKRIIENDIDLTEKENIFVTQMHGTSHVSVKQLFYLRDINNRY